MSAAHDAMAALLAPLPDTDFVINEPSLNPVIPPGKHGLVYYVPSVAPVPQLDGARRALTWSVAVISPITGMKAAGGPLLDALFAVLRALEQSKTATWTSSAMEPYNETLWCYTVQVTMYATDTPDTPDTP